MGCDGSRRQTVPDMRHLMHSMGPNQSYSLSETPEQFLVVSSINKRTCSYNDNAFQSTVR